MNISVIQPDVFWEDKSHNLNHLEDIISTHNSKTDIIILPEMFNTGFSMNPQILAESPDGNTFNWMMETSRKGNFGLCGSFIVKVSDLYFNRWIFTTPENEFWYYDKRHLFTMGGEKDSFSAGNERLVFRFRGVRINPYICYDLRFPVWSRNRNDADLIIYAANWPESRSEVWKTLLRARAIENQCYVAGANRIGTDGNMVKYCGDSLIADPWGKIIASAKEYEECSISADLSMNDLADFRKNFPVTADADNFTINF
jgi:predicted amidohydrolase